ncbi:MAG: 2OG-Fe(II) oxygenase [Methyloligellaceae bacterium]
MSELSDTINRTDWDQIALDIQRKGYGIIPGFMSRQQCDQFIAHYNDDVYRKTVVMERYRFGLGEYKYFDYPLPDMVEEIRAEVYPKLAPVANSWMRDLRIDKLFPDVFKELQDECHRSGQLKPTALILKYGQGGFNTLHQDLYGEVYFPLQCVVMLSEPGQDFTGGEFVLTQQIPRAQSKAIVLTPGKGDMIIFTTNFRPEKGSKGFFRVTMKHGVSEVRSGERYALGVIFHDAES